MMEVLKFKCELLSDIVLNDTPATEGKAQTLPFIPGSNFLGVVASKLYNKEDERSFLIFHSGHVRFGDANPSLEKRRSVKVPAAIYHPKLGSIERESYVNYLIPDPSSAEMRAKQLKQERKEFYVFGKEQAYEVKVDKDFFIKSAYDSARRRAQDEQMFGLEALQRGVTLYFSVEIDEEAQAYREEIIRALVGQRHIGRSRTAQFGLVEISPYDFEEPTSTDEAVELGTAGRCVAVYADSRLIFLDDNGYPSFHPTAQDLGIEEGQILWDKCQVLTFQYAPWNYKLRAYDSDRCGFEKGSVFIVQTNAQELHERYIGSYCNEGFGRVLYNPAFLQADPATGRSSCRFMKSSTSQKDSATPAPEALPALTGADQLLWNYLGSRVSLQSEQNKVWNVVNSFVKEHGGRFKRDEAFASQWGSIRNLAMVANTPDNLIGAIEGYLNHGVAKDKWEKNGRKKVLDKFLKKHQNSGYLQELVINLASMMGKHCSNNK